MTSPKINRNLCDCDFGCQYVFAIAQSKMASVEDVLCEVALEFGYASLRDKQKDAIFGFVRGRDVFVSLPTGSGKSLCYSILPEVFDRVKESRQYRHCCLSIDIFDEGLSVLTN